MRLLPVTPADIPALSALARTSFTETFGHLYPPDDLSDFLEASYSPGVLAHETIEPAQMWRLLADEDGALAGYLQCGPVSLPHPDADSATQGEIKRIYVLHSHQGRGGGKLLMDAAQAWLAETYGDAPQWLGVWSGNVKAQRFYAGLGFTQVGSYVFPVGRTRDDEFILRRVPVAQP